MDSKLGRAIAFVLTTAVCGYLGYLLYDAIQTEFLYLNNDDSYALEAALVCVPLALTILWSIVYHRYTWIGGVLCVLACTIFNSSIGDITSPDHIPLFVASVAVPYLLCAFGILHDPDRSVPVKTKTATTTSTYTYTPTVSDYSGSSDDYGSSSSSDYGVYSPTMSDVDKWNYIQNNCSGEFSYGAMNRIDNDPTLTYTQKEDLKRYLMVYGD